MAVKSILSGPVRQCSECGRSGCAARFACRSGSPDLSGAFGPD